VCQNQSLADSHAELAIDLKNQVREKMKQGMTNEQIVEYMVARYGDFVLYRPPMKATTLFLWFGPLLLLVIGLGALFYRLSRRRAAAPAALSESERARAAALLAPSDAGEPR
jgi:cytochrome c-type biogenesis protein CcmH